MTWKQQHLHEYWKFVQDSTIFRKSHFWGMWKVTKISTIFRKGHFSNMWKVTKIPTKKQAVTKAIAEKPGIIHSEKQSSNNIASNKTAQFAKTFYTPWYCLHNAMKYEINIWEYGTNKFDKVKFSKFCDLSPKNKLLDKISCRSNVNV